MSGQEKTPSEPSEPPSRDGSPFASGDIASSSAHRRQRRSRLNPSASATTFNSDDDTETSTSYPTKRLEDDYLHKSRSFDDLEVVFADSPKLPMSPLGLGSPTITSPNGALESLNLEGAINTTPLIRPLSPVPSSEHSGGILEVQTARYPSEKKPAVPRAVSAGPAVAVDSISAPATVRDTPLVLPHRTVTSVSETVGSPHHPAAPAAMGGLLPATAFRRDTRPLNVHNSVPEAQSFGDYLTAELLPGPSYHTTDVVWGQTERDRVYNALLAVPFQLERLLWLGCALCIDSFLAVFTWLPIRVAGAVYTAALCILHSLLGRRKSSSTRSGNGSANSEHSGTKSAPIVKLRGDQIYDMLCALMFAIVITFLWRLKAGSIYYWVKDLTQEFLKLSVLHTALELSDKICCSFLVDVLEALAASCTALASHSRWTATNAFNVMCDAAVALTLLVAHGTALMAQALVFGVAMNSQKNTLLALLIASNFTEIKGTVLKRFDPTKLFVLASQDVVERFHLFIVLSFVLVEEMSGTGAALPSRRLLGQCGYVLLAEMVIDVTKHAVLGKFNDIRPGVYREFTKDLCEKVSTAQSHTMHKLVGFEPFAPAALFFRVAMSYVALRREDTAGISAARIAFGTVIAWSALLLFKLTLGFVVKRGAVAYLRHYEEMRGKARVRKNVAFAAIPSPAGVPAMPASPTVGGVGSKKES